MKSKLKKKSIKLFWLEFLDQVENNKEEYNRTQIYQISRANRSDSAIIGNNLNRPNEVSSKPLFFNSFYQNLHRILKK